MKFTAHDIRPVATADKVRRLPVGGGGSCVIHPNLPGWLLWDSAVRMICACPPPFHPVRIIKIAIAHEAQCEAQGGLPARTRREIERIADGGVRVTDLSSRTVLQPGAHLVREWNGRTYRVEVLETGFRMNAKTWPSLSALARPITGTNWSGPRFLGLARRKEPSR